MYSPLELDQIEFEKKVFGGYDTDDVDKTFEVLKKDYETLYIENADIKMKVKELTEKLSESENLKETLQAVLVSAQKTGEEVRANAQKEAELILKNAEAEANDKLRKAEEDIKNLERRKEELQREVDVFVTKMSALFEAQIKYLNKTE